MYLRQAALTSLEAQLLDRLVDALGEGERAAEVQVGGQLAGDVAVLGTRQPAQVEQADPGLVELLLA